MSALDRPFLGTFQNCEKQQFASSCLSIRPSAWNNSVPTGRIFMKSYICALFENLSTEFKFHYNLTRITSTLHEDLRTFMIRFSATSLKCLLGLQEVKAPGSSRHSAL